MIAFYNIKRNSYYAIVFSNVKDAIRLNLRGKRCMNVEKEIVPLLRAHAEHAVSANTKEQPFDYSSFKM